MFIQKFLLSVNLSVIQDFCWLFHKCQSPGRARGDAFGRGLFETFGNRTLERYGYPDIKTPADKGQTEFFAGPGGNLNAETAVDTLAGFVNDFRVLGLLNEQTTLAFVSSRLGTVIPGILPEFAAIGLPAITMQASGGFLFGLLVIETLAFLRHRYAGIVARTGDEPLFLAVLDFADSSVKWFGRTRYLAAGQILAD